MIFQLSLFFSCQYKAETDCVNDSLIMLVFIIIFLINSVLTIDLNIYKTLTEIRQIQTGLGKYEHLFLNDEYENLIENSINWHGTPFIKQEITKSIEILKNTIVKVKQSTTCECQIIEAKIIDPNTMLLENIRTGNYFYADKYSIEYPSKKSIHQGTILTIDFGNSLTKFNGTLSYLVHGITWQPNYEFTQTNFNLCTLHGYANIHNRHQQDYTIDRTYFYGHDLSFRFRTNTNSSSIKFHNEEKGFYSYALDTNFTLHGTSSIRLPFLTTEIPCEFYYQTMIYVSSGQMKGLLYRTYEFISDRFLPKGSLTVRNEDFLLGQTDLPDLPENVNQTITLGQDPDVRYLIDGNLTAINKKNNTKITSRTYSMNVYIFNYKTKDIKGQLNFHASPHTTIINSTCSSIRLNVNLIQLQFQFESRHKFHCQFTMSIDA